MASNHSSTRMNSPTLTDLAEAVPTALPVASVGGLNDNALLRAIREIEELGRHVDALRVVTAGKLAARSRTEDGPAGPAARKGCRSANELLQRLTQISSATAAARLGLATLTRPSTDLSGAPMPARFDHVRAALETGELGVEAAVALTKNLAPLQDRVHPDALDAAERELVAAATGTSPDSSVPASADEIRIQASVWRATLDPDGLEPDEAHAMAKRGFRLGPERNGLVPVSGGLLPEAAGRVKRLFDAYLTPTTAPAFLHEEELTDKNATNDPRPKDQQRHDILIGVLDAMARSGDTPPRPVGRRIRTTECSSAGSTTARSTPRAGRSGCGPERRRCRHHPGSTTRADGARPRRAEPLSPPE